MIDIPSRQEVETLRGGNSARRNEGRVTRICSTNLRSRESPRFWSWDWMGHSGQEMWLWGDYVPCCPCLESLHGLFYGSEHKRPSRKTDETAAHVRCVFKFDSGHRGVIKTFVN